MTASHLEELIPVPPGGFVMGSNNLFFSESPPHPVTFQRGFLLAKYPVTQEQWADVMGANPSAFPHSPDRPVDSVSWDQAEEFCRRASARSGRRVHLPSEAEWEYACRAGTTGDFFFGDYGPYTDGGMIPTEVRQALAEFAWFDLNSDATQPVGRKRPNPWGLHDMIGNVWEWCADVWHAGYDGAPADGGPCLRDDDAQPRRCLRGGAWDMDAFRCRSSYRSYDHRTLATPRFGLRVAVDL